MRAKAGLRGHTKDTIEYGQSVEFTGNSEVLDGIKWAEVKYGNKTGWVLANSLRTENPDLDIDKNVPKEIIVNQGMNTEERTAYLNKMIPEWMAENPSRSTDLNMIEWYKNKGANVKYTGTYCLPIKDILYVSQGFYGSYSHAGSYDSRNHKYNYEEGMYGAVDIAASKGTTVYSVLGGKVVYTYKESPIADMHRVTVETKINGETYYLEYLHMDEVNVETGQTLRAGTQLGKSGGWGNYNSKAFNVHLDFRIYKFKDENDKNFSSDSAKQFFDPLEFFDFDVQFEYNMSDHDYH